MIDTPNGLEDRLASFVVEKDVARERRRFGTSGFLSLVGVALLFFAFGYFMRSASESGFSAYLSLARTDTTDLFSHFKEFSFSLAESIPAFSLALVLGALALFAAELRLSVRAAKRSRMNHFTLS